MLIIIPKGDGVSVNFDAPIPSVLETIQEVTELIANQKERDKPVERQKTMLESKASFGHSFGICYSLHTIFSRNRSLILSLL